MPPTKQLKATAPVMDAFLQLIDGAAVEHVDLNSITISSEIEHLHSAGVFHAKKQKADAAGSKVPKRALFDDQCKYYFGPNPHMHRDKSGNKKNNIIGKQMFDEDPGSDEVRRIANAVNYRVHHKIKDWEIGFCGRKEDDRFGSLKNQHAVAAKWKGIVNKMKEKPHKYDDKKVGDFIKTELGRKESKSRSLLLLALPRTVNCDDHVVYVCIYVDWYIVITLVLMVGSFDSACTCSGRYSLS
jgi:hypothetical protein